MYVQNTLGQSVHQSYPQNNNPFFNSATQESTKLPATKATDTSALDMYLKNFSEKAQINFESLSSGLPQETKDELIQTLNSIGKAAAFSSMNGFEAQDERLVVSRYFQNFEGVLSDDLIKQMIMSKLENSNIEHGEFLKSFADSLTEPIQSIDISV